MSKNNLESVVADTKSLEMTPEIEQEINKIYEEKEGIKMLNNNEIKRGTEITNGKEATIYTLEFLKDTLTIYSLYLLDWVEWLENENSYIKDNIVRDLYDSEKDSELRFLASTKLENGVCKNIINETIAKIDNAKNVIAENKNFIWYQCAIEDIKDSVEKIDALTEYFHAVAMLGFLTDNLSFYESIVSTPIFQGLSMIENIIEELENVNEETFQMELEKE